MVPRFQGHDLARIQEPETLVQQQALPHNSPALRQASQPNAELENLCTCVKLSHTAGSPSFQCQAFPAIHRGLGTCTGQRMKGAVPSLSWAGQGVDKVPDAPPLAHMVTLKPFMNFFQKFLEV